MYQWSMLKLIKISTTWKLTHWLLNIAVCFCLSARVDLEKICLWENTGEKKTWPGDVNTWSGEDLNTRRTGEVAGEWSKIFNTQCINVQCSSWQKSPQLENWHIDYWTLLFAFVFPLEWILRRFVGFNPFGVIDSTRYFESGFLLIITISRSLQGFNMNNRWFTNG
jgi:hypothetical protein